MRFFALTKYFLAAALSLSLLGARANGPSKGSAKTAFVEKVLELTNLQRKKAGLTPLVLQMKLSESAEWKAEDMASHNYFDHMDRPGHDYTDRAHEFGYEDWTYLGENIAAGQRTPEEVVAEWMASPGHRENILRPEFREIGIAYATGSHSDYKRYWVQEFGAR